MTNKRINWGIVLVLVLFIFLSACVLFLDLSSLNQTRIWVNLKVISKILLGGIPFIILLIVTVGLLTSKWGFKIEKLSLGGFNLLFDKPENLYVRTVISFLDTKRTLYKINPERDNFDETLTSYYKTYEFFRTEMKILDNQRRIGRWQFKRKQKELYDITNEIIQHLNEFLTMHQSNYRRWYKYISDKNEVESIDGSGQVLKFHMNPIADIQKQYYRYEEICNGFRVINEFFNSNASKHFDVNTQKWERT